MIQTTSNYLIVMATHKTKKEYWYGYWKGNHFNWSHWQDSIKECLNVGACHSYIDNTTYDQYIKRKNSTITILNSTTPITYAIVKNKIPEFII